MSPGVAMPLHVALPSVAVIGLVAMAALHLGLLGSLAAWLHRRSRRRPQGRGDG